jgi:hypothetical protein
MKQSLESKLTETPLSSDIMSTIVLPCDIYPDGDGVDNVNDVCNAFGCVFCQHLVVNIANKIVDN